MQDNLKNLEISTLSFSDELFFFFKKPDVHSIRQGLDPMHYLDNRKSEHSGFPSSTATSIKNGVFTNPQSKSHINNKRRNSRTGNQEGHSNTFREEYPLSVRSLSTKKHGISKSSHSKRKSSITYLNKQNNLTSRNNRAFIDEIESQHENNIQNNLQRSLSKRQIPDMISGESGGSDINPRRLTPSSGETFIDSNSEEGEHFTTRRHSELKSSNSFHNSVQGGHTVHHNNQEKKVNRSNSRYNKQRYDDHTRPRRRRSEKDYYRQNVSWKLLK